MVQFANTEFLLTKPHQVLNRSSKSGNVCYHKNQEFSSFTTNLQSKQKRIKKKYIIALFLILETFNKKISLRNLTRFHGGLLTWRS